MCTLSLIEIDHKPICGEMRRTEECRKAVEQERRHSQLIKLSSQSRNRGKCRPIVHNPVRFRVADRCSHVCVMTNLKSLKSM